MRVAEQGPDAVPIALSAVGERFVLHWGEMGSRWGVNRTVSQIHALIYLAGRPLHAEEIAATLRVARSNVSTSLRDLLHWNLVRVVHRMDDRRDHFETARDPWDLLRTIVRERKAREFDPTIAVLRECVSDPAFAAEDAATRVAAHRDAGAHGSALVLERGHAAARHADAHAPHEAGRQGARASAAREEALTS